jgi:hypothetical protein
MKVPYLHGEIAQACADTPLARAAELYHPEFAR